MPPHAHGLQLHDLNNVTMGEPLAKSLCQTLFWNDGEDDHGLYSRLLTFSDNDVFQFRQMDTGAGYRGWEVQCHSCGVVAWAVWTTASTIGWKDQQRANLLAFFELEVPGIYLHGLEDRLPMV